MTWHDHFFDWQKRIVAHPTLYGTVAVLLYLQRDLTATVLNFAGEPNSAIANAENAYLVILMGYFVLAVVIEPALYATVHTALDARGENE